MPTAQDQWVLTLGTELSGSAFSRMRWNKFYPQNVAIFAEATDLSGVRISSRWSQGLFGSNDTKVHPDHRSAKDIAMEKLARADLDDYGNVTLQHDDEASLTPQEKHFLHWSPYPIK